MKTAQKTSSIPPCARGRIRGRAKNQELKACSSEFVALGLKSFWLLTLLLPSGLTENENKRFGLLTQVCFISKKRPVTFREMETECPK